jgi:hypothetical protein
VILSNGYAAHSYYFGKKQDDQAEHEYPDGTSHSPIINSSSGKIYGYAFYKIPAGTANEGNHTYVENGDVLILYLHLATNSGNSAITGGSKHPTNDYYWFSQHDGPTIQAGIEIAKVGPNAYHLHFEGHNKYEHAVTIPVAFENYYVSKDGITDWKFVKKGHPKTGEFIKRMS